MGIDTSLIWTILKWGYVVAFGLYFVFAIVAYRQVQLMNRTLNGMLEVPLRLVALSLVVISGMILLAAGLGL